MNISLSRYLEPYEYSQIALNLGEVELTVGEFKEIDLSYTTLKKITLVDYENADSLPKGLVLAEFTDDPSRLGIISSWVPGLAHEEGVIIVKPIVHAVVPRSKIIITEPFWYFVLQDGLRHIVERDFRIAVVEFAIGFEAFLNEFLRHELATQKGWSKRKIDGYVGTDRLAIKDVVQLILGDVLNVSYSSDCFSNWANHVKRKRDNIVHGKALDIGEDDALRACLAVCEFILNILENLKEDILGSREDSEREILAWRKDLLAEQIQNIHRYQAAKGDD